MDCKLDTRRWIHQLQRCCRLEPVPMACRTITTATAHHEAEAIPDSYQQAATLPEASQHCQKVFQLDPPAPFLSQWQSPVTSHSPVASPPDGSFSRVAHSPAAANACKTCGRTASLKAAVGVRGPEATCPCRDGAWESGIRAKSSRTWARAWRRSLLQGGFESDGRERRRAPVASSSPCSCI